MREIFLVFIGGGTGSCCRYFLAILFNQISSNFPVGTFLANIFSCLILGFFSMWAINKISFSDELRFLVMVGFCGGFSTFSTFDNELLGLIKGGQFLHAVIYGSISIVVGLGALLLGISLGQKLLS